jgi:hypothetical protein
LAVSVETVAGGWGRGGGGQGTVREGGREEVRIGRIETAGVVGDDVRGGGAQGDGGGQGGLLPAAWGFIGKGDRAEQPAGGRPEVTGVRADVFSTFIEADGSDGTWGSGPELYADFDGVRIVVRDTAGTSLGLKRLEAEEGLGVGEVLGVGEGGTGVGLAVGEVLGVGEGGTGVGVGAAVVTKET